MLKTLRNPYLSIFLSILMILTSCNQYREIQDETEFLNAENLRSIHLKIKNDFKQSKNPSGTFSKVTSEEDEVQQIFDENFDAHFEYAQTNGLEALFETQNLNTTWPSVIDWALDNLETEGFYDEVLTRANIQNEDEADLFFAYLETYLEYERMINDPANKNNQYAKLSGCGRAVVGTILMTAVFAGVTAATGGFGTAAAVGFLISKSWGTYNVIAACGK